MLGCIKLNVTYETNSAFTHIHVVPAGMPILDMDLFNAQFAYWANRSTDDAISTALNSALTHLDSKDSSVRMLFLDFGSAFNTIIPQQLIQKLDCLELNISLCNWFLDFLTGRPQAVRVGNSASSIIVLMCSAPYCSPC